MGSLLSLVLVFRGICRHGLASWVTCGAGGEVAERLRPHASLRPRAGGGLSHCPEGPLGRVGLRVSDPDLGRQVRCHSGISEHRSAVQGATGTPLGEEVPEEALVTEPDVTTYPLVPVTTCPPSAGHSETHRGAGERTRPSPVPRWPRRPSPSPGLSLPLLKQGA